MTLLLTGGGTGGHITPLLAVARELKIIDPSVKIIGVCEKNGKFAELYTKEPAIDEVHQIAAGKYRRYSSVSRIEKLKDVKTQALNIRDVGRTVKGLLQARKLLKQLKPDGILVKGGFVGVPVGLAAKQLHVPLITHDSDSIPGLANRLIASAAVVHATGMPPESYPYPIDKTVYTGIPVASQWRMLKAQEQLNLRKDLGLGDCRFIITVTGGSQGGSQLNEDMVTVTSRLMQRYEGIGILHIAGATKSAETQSAYKTQLLADEQRRVVVKGFVDDLYRYTGAADVVVSRASATTIAELAIQKKAVVLVPGRLAGAHQEKNADVLSKAGKVLMAPYGDAETLCAMLESLLLDRGKREQLASALHEMAKPDAARELAQLVYQTFKRPT